MKKTTTAKVKNTTKKAAPKKAAAKKAVKRVLTEEQRLKRNAYMREYLKKYYQIPEHKKAKSEYQKARYQRIKAENARSERTKTKHEMAKRFSDGLKKIEASKKYAASGKKTVKIGGKGGSKKGK